MHRFSCNDVIAGVEKLLSGHKSASDKLSEWNGSVLSFEIHRETKRCTDTVHTRIHVVNTFISQQRRMFQKDNVVVSDLKDTSIFMNTSFLLCSAAYKHTHIHTQTLILTNTHTHTLDHIQSSSSICNTIDPYIWSCVNTRHMHAHAQINTNTQID